MNARGNQLWIYCALVLAFMSSSCATPGEGAAQNPLLAPWTGSYQGVPPFDAVEFRHFRPALKTAMEKALASYGKVASDPAVPTFANTMVPMEQASLELDRQTIIFYIWQSTLSSDKLQALEKEMASQLAEFEDKIMLNPKLFSRVQALYKDPREPLSSEQKRLIWSYYTSFVKKGAALPAAKKQKVAEINKAQAELTTLFSQNLLNDESSKALVLKDPADLKGLPSSLVAAAAAAAAERKMAGQWVIANTRSSMQPFVTYSARRDLREKAFKIWTSRGDFGDASDNNGVVQKILKGRAERSALMGFANYAEWQLSDKMAQKPERAMELLLKVWKPAVAQVKKDVADMTALARAEGQREPLAAWDYRYYAEKLRKKRYAFDMDAVKPFLQLPNIQKAMFWMAKKLYDFEFSPATDVPVYHPDVTVFKVERRQELVGLWYFDPYARKGKRSGAWMNAYRIQHKLAGAKTLPIVSNNSNFVKAGAGQVTLISWDDASTMFHEFGHALHGLSSDVVYPSLAGTRTARDFVEFPSQIHEDWLSTPEVLRFLVNDKGAPLPASLIAKLKRAAAFNEGFATVEYLASALVDMKLHLDPSGKIDPRRFEEKTLAQLGMPKEIVMRHRIPQFAHIFSGEGYSAGYYSYLWADVLRHDAFQAFEEANGPYDPVVAKRFQQKVLSVGNTVDPAQAFRDFRGRDPEVGALLKSKGFSATRKR